MIKNLGLFFKRTNFFSRMSQKSKKKPEINENRKLIVDGEEG